MAVLEGTPALADVAALAQRLRAAADVALPTPPARTEDPATDADVCLDGLVRIVAGTRDASLAWLLLTVVAGAFPESADVRHVLRTATLGDVDDLRLAVLDRALPVAATHRSAGVRAVLGSTILVDVDSTARSDFHNGIQRTAREVVREWHRNHDITLVAWTDTGGSTRSLTAREEGRTARWGEADDATSADPADTLLVVPWRTTLVLTEVPLSNRSPRLAALAEFSGTAVVAIGYDAIPVISADLRPLGEPNGFASYLSAIKRATRVAAISRSAAAEFSGFCDALDAQGLPGPEVLTVPLPVTVPAAPEGFVRAETPRPVVLSLGRLEPHKNQGVLLHAAERLWRAGLDFELHLVGGPGWDTTRVDAQLARITAARRPLQWHRSIHDDELWSLLRNASFTVFLSLHEGFGLPVAESLACGTPVLTASFGSQQEIAEGGGCLTVDPRDDEAVVAALRSLLTDSALLDRLRVEAAEYAVSSWDDYAGRLWAALIEGEQR